MTTSGTDSWENLLLMLQSPLMRTESRGSHYREDFPGRSDDDWLCWIKVRQAADGAMELLKHPLTL